MAMKFHETVMVLLSFISTYFPFPYISVTFSGKCFEWIAVFVLSKKLKFHDGWRVLRTLFGRCEPHHIFRLLDISLAQSNKYQPHTFTKNCIFTIPYTIKINTCSCFGADTHTYTIDRLLIFNTVHFKRKLVIFVLTRP